MNQTRFILGATLLCLTFGCTVKERLGLQSSFPVMTTLELTKGSSTAPVGKIICIAGEIVACDVASSVVILDHNIECVLNVFEGEGLVNLMKSYSDNVGGAVAIRGVLSKPINSRYQYRLQPSAPCISECHEAKRKLLAEKGQRPSLRFTSFYRGLGESGALPNERSARIPTKR